MAIEKRYVVIAILFLFLFTGLILFKTPLRNSEFSKYTKSIIKTHMNNVEKFISVNTRSIKANELILTCSNDTEFQIYSLLPDKNVLLTQFNKKQWGTWNIEGWYFSNDGSIPSKDFSLMVGGGSDWEYVFRVKKDSGKDYEFSGGNHGNETLKAFKLINLADGSLVILEKGKEIKLRQLRIEEKTYLTLDGNVTSKYAEVTRVYLVSPSKITLATNFEFTSDIFMGTSYVCMLPASKEYGRYVLFKESGNIYTTPPAGETLTTDKFENFLGKEKSTTVEIWGDYKPSYKFITSIRNSEMVDNFRNKLKTFYWDGNKGANKLYFSKFDNETNTKIVKGTKWQNYAEWHIDIKK